MAGPAALAIDRTAAVVRTGLDDDSWVELVNGFVADADTWMDTLRTGIRWHETEVLRYDRYVPEKRLSAGVRSEDHLLLRQTELHLRSRFAVAWTGVAALLYRDGNDFQGFHGDREMKWLDDTLIAIVVLGERRPFTFRPRATSSQLDRRPAGTHPDDVVLLPGHGDLLVMGGACQRDWLHTVPPVTTTEPRISLTWRWTSRRGRPDTNPTFHDGRSFSDGPRRAGSRVRR
ncbi:MAG: alpha-ketoglutarate-dependent dioxygenase AlkB [Ilumatobacteraceae bacterium]